MRDVARRNILKSHVNTVLVAVPRFVIADDTALHITSGLTGARLIAVALTCGIGIIGFRTEIWSHATESLLTAADVQRTLFAWRCSISSALRVGITVALAHPVWRLAITTGSRAMAAASAFGTVGTIRAGFCSTAGVIISSIG